MSRCVFSAIGNNLMGNIKFTKHINRIIEFFYLLKALGHIELLSYLTFNCYQICHTKIYAINLNSRTFKYLKVK